MILIILENIALIKHRLDLLSPDLQTMQSVEGSSLLTNEPIISSTFHPMYHGHTGGYYGGGGGEENEGNGYSPTWSTLSFETASLHFEHCQLELPPSRSTTWCQKENK